MRRLQTIDKKLFSPEGGRIALSANERIAEFLDFAIQAKFAYVNKLKPLPDKDGRGCLGLKIGIYHHGVSSSFAMAARGSACTV